MRDGIEREKEEFISIRNEQNKGQDRRNGMVLNYF